MKRIIKILLGIVAGIIGLMILAAIVLPILIDADDIKKAMSNAVRERTGRELTIAGELDISVFPWLAIEVSDLTLSNAAGFGDQPFAGIGEARVGVRVMPLLSKRVEVGEVRLDSLQLNLAVNKQGRNNWDDLAQDQAPADEPAESAEPSSFSSGGIAGLKIIDALVDYDDRAAGTHYRLSKFSLETGALGDDDPVDVELEMLLEDLTAGRSMNVAMATVASLDLDAERYDLAGLALELVAVDGALPGGQQKIDLRVPSLALDMGAQTMNVEAWQLELVGIELEGELSATNIVDNPSYSGRFESSEFSPSELMTAMQLGPVVTADPDVLKKARAAAAFSGDSRNLSLSALEFALDQSRLTGELSIKNFDSPAVDFEMSLDEINIDRYMAPASDAPAESGEPVDVELPGDMLDGLNVKGQFTIGKAIASGLTFSDIVVGIVIRDNKLRMNPLSALFYGGAYDGDITLDSSGSVPIFSMNEKLENVLYEKMAADLLDNPHLSGTASGTVRLSGRGKTSSELKRNLNGSIGLVLADGAYEGINVWYELRKGLALFKGRPAPEPEPDRTVFSNLHANATVTNGVLQTNDMVADLPFMTMTGSGNVNLPDDKVDMRFDAVIRSTPELTQDAVTADLAGRRVPFKVSGPLADPGISVDWGGLLTDEAKNKLLEKIGIDTGPGGTAEGEDPPPSVEDQLKEKAARKLNKLLGGKDDDDGG